MYLGGIVLREIKRDVYIAVELTGRPTIRVAIIKRKNERLGCEPMRKH